MYRFTKYTVTQTDGQTDRQSDIQTDDSIMLIARRHGTASLSNCGLQLCPLRHLYKDSKVISSAASASV